MKIDISKAWARVRGAVLVVAFALWVGICVTAFAGLVWVFLGFALMVAAHAQQPPPVSGVVVSRGSLEIVCFPLQHADKMTRIPEARLKRQLLLSDNDGDDWYHISDSERLIPGVVAVHIKAKEAICVVGQEDQRPKA